jgi:hypothetical protein
MSAIQLRTINRNGTLGTLRNLAVNPGCSGCRPVLHPKLVTDARGISTVVWFEQGNGYPVPNRIRLTRLVPRHQK